MKGNYADTQGDLKAYKSDENQDGVLEDIASQVERLGHIQPELLGFYEANEWWRAPSSNNAEDIWGRFELLVADFGGGWRGHRAGVSEVGSSRGLMRTGWFTHMFIGI